MEIDTLLDPVAAAETIRQIAHASPNQFSTLIQDLIANPKSILEVDPAVMGGVIRALHTLVLRSETPTETIRRASPDQIAALERALPEGTPNRYLLMHLLSLARTGDHLVLLPPMLVAQPPHDWMHVGQVLSPLMQYSDWEPSDFFPQIFDAFVHPSVAAPVLDVANHLYRSERVERHPATDRLESLLGLLGGVSGRLGRFESEPQAFGDSVDQVQRTLGEAVALAVSLCDALGLIGDTRAIGKLNQVLTLRHRRVQTEAAGALARLGDKEGQDRLIGLAEEPSARLRVLAYADELDLGHLIDDAYRTDEAVAQAKLAVWLSQPQNMGVPPSEIAVVDSRRQFWPSYSDPVDCYLLRFEYDFGSYQYQNIGIVGPVEHVFGVQVDSLDYDDAYAMYAGWHVEHPDILTVQIDHWNAAQRRLANPIIEHLDRQGFDSYEVSWLGFVLDENAIAGTAVRDDLSYVVVSDGLETIEIETSGTKQPLTPLHAWYLYMGRKMLRVFNS